MAVPPIYVDRSTAGGHEVFEDADWELQDLVRLEVQWASFGSTGLPLWLSWSRICLQCRRPGFYPFIGKIPQRREKLPTPVVAFHSSSFSGLENSMDSIVHGWQRVKHDII